MSSIEQRLEYLEEANDVFAYAKPRPRHRPQRPYPLPALRQSTTMP